MRGIWSFLGDPEALKVIDQAVGNIHRKFPNHMEREDLRQEAVIALATQEDLWPALDREDWGLLRNGLERDLEHVCLKMARRAGRDEALPEGLV